MLRRRGVEVEEGLSEELVTAFLESTLADLKAKAEGGWRVHRPARRHCDDENSAFGVV